MRDDAPVELMLHCTFLYYMELITTETIGDLKCLSLKAQRGEKPPHVKNEKPTKEMVATLRIEAAEQQVKNDVSGITAEMLAEFREKTFFQYRKVAWP